MIDDTTESNLAQQLENLRENINVSVDFDQLELLIYLLRTTRQLRNEVQLHRQQLRRLLTTTDEAEIYLKLTPSGLESHITN